MKPLALLVSLPVRFYRRVLSPLKRPTCRFQPTCSQYALDALRVHGAFRGLFMAVKRILRCQPYGRGGLDPVPGTEDMFPPAKESPSHDD